MNKEELTQKIIEFQLLSQQIQQGQQQLNLISQQLNEIRALSGNIAGISDVRQNCDMYHNLGVGVYIKSKLEAVKKLLINVGSNVCVQKSPEETIKIISRQIEELENFLQNMERQLQNIAERAEALREEIAKEQEKNK